MNGEKFNIGYFKDARVVFCDKDSNVVDETYKSAIAGARAALRRFGLKPVFPLINIFIAPGRKEYDKLVAHLTRTPTDKWRIGQTQGHDLYLISPNAYPKDVSISYLGPDGTCDRAMYRSCVAHELVHIMEEYFSPKGVMELRPQWWSEGLAVYLTGQYRDRITSKYRKQDLAAGRLPGINELKGPPAYIWGWSLVRYI